MTQIWQNPRARSPATGDGRRARKHRGRRRHAASVKKQCLHKEAQTGHPDTKNTRMKPSTPVHARHPDNMIIAYTSPPSTQQRDNRHANDRYTEGHTNTRHTHSTHIGSSYTPPTARQRQPLDDTIPSPALPTTSVANPPSPSLPLPRSPPPFPASRPLPAPSPSHHDGNQYANQPHHARTTPTQTRGNLRPRGRSLASLMCHRTVRRDWHGVSPAPHRSARARSPTPPSPRLCGREAPSVTHKAGKTRTLVE